MPCRRAVSYHFPDRRFNQIGRKVPGETALDLFDAGNVSNGPDLLQSAGNVGKGRKVLAPGMQVDQIVVALFGKATLRPNPEGTPPDACEPAGRLCFGKIAITALVVFHARLGNEQRSIRKAPDDIWQIVMRFPLERVANRERRVLGDRQSIGCGKLWANIAARVADHQRMILKPEQEALFELATEWKLDRGRRAAHLEARNPPQNGAIRDFEQIDAFRCWRDHRRPSCAS